MKLLSSIPTAAKVGGAGILGGGGLAGTGLLIHKKIQEKSINTLDSLTDLDKELMEESEASLIFSTETNKGDFSPVGESQKEVSAKVITSSTKSTSKFAANSNKWVCVIKGVVTTTDIDNLNLGQDTNFVKGDQTKKFEDKFKEAGKEKTNLKGFVTSCANNRTKAQESNKNPLSSEIKVELTKVKGDSDLKKYEFSQESINSIFAGTWDNSKQQ